MNAMSTTINNYKAVNEYLGKMDKLVETQRPPSG